MQRPSLPRPSDHCDPKFVSGKHPPNSERCTQWLESPSGYRCRNVHHFSIFLRQGLFTRPLTLHLCYSKMPTALTVMCSNPSLWCCISLVGDITPNSLRSHKLLVDVLNCHQVNSSWLDFITFSAPASFSLQHLQPVLHLHKPSCTILKDLPHRAQVYWNHSQAWRLPQNSLYQTASVVAPIPARQQQPSCSKKGVQYYGADGNHSYLDQLEGLPFA